MGQPKIMSRTVKCKAKKNSSSRSRRSPITRSRSQRNDMDDVLSMIKRQQSLTSLTSTINEWDDVFDKMEKEKLKRKSSRRGVKPASSTSSPSGSQRRTA